MHVIVDDRESRSGVPEYLEKMENTTFVFKRLPVGDYLIDNRILFERKTIKDFSISLIDNRLFNQACRLAASSYLSILLLEGTISEIKNLKIRRESIQGAMISLMLVYGIPLLRSFGPEETARLMLYSSTQLHRSIKGSIHRSGYRPKTKRKRQLYILQGLPGIGPVRAEQLLQTFGSVKAVINTSPEELSSIGRIGDKTAKKIFMSLN